MLKPTRVLSQSVNAFQQLGQVFDGIGRLGQRATVEDVWLAEEAAQSSAGRAAISRRPHRRGRGRHRIGRQVHLLWRQTGDEFKNTDIRIGKTTKAVIWEVQFIPGQPSMI